MNVLVLETFGKLAGASFGMDAVGECSADIENILAYPRFGWSLVISILLRCSTSESTLAVLLTCGGHDVYGEFGHIFREAIAKNWGAWLAVLLMSPDPKEWWRRFTASFPLPCGEDALLRDLLGYLLLIEEGNLYDPLTVQTKMYDDPRQCVIIRIGAFLRQRADDVTCPNRALAAAWRPVLIDRLGGYLDRQARGFAPDSPQLENLLLAALELAEWRIQPNWSKIQARIADAAARDSERLSRDQLAFCGTLFGWLGGYAQASLAIANRDRRRNIAQGAMLLASRRAALRDGASALVPSPEFYAADDGVQTTWSPVPMEAQIIRRKTTIEITEQWAERDSACKNQEVRHHVENTVRMTLVDIGLTGTVSVNNQDIGALLGVVV